MHLLLVISRFYEDLADELARGAAEAIAHTKATWDEVSVPGALEIAPAIRFALENGHYDGFVALGCVIRGETSHYETVCEESARALTWLAMEHQAPIGNGILTVETMDQAWKRARMNEGNKGGFAAHAAMRLVTLKRQFSVASTV